MLPTSERAQLIAVARLYYEDNLTQAQIAQRLGVSRPLISRMLTKAREVGIVHIEICAGEAGETDLLEQLQLKYGLLGGCIVSQGRGQWQKAARYLATETAGDGVLGLGWGYTLGEICSGMEKGRLHQQLGLVLPLIGQAHIPNKGYHPDTLAQLWAEVCGRSSMLLGCPAFPASAEERDELEAQSKYQELAAQWQQLDAAVVAICGYPSVPDEATATRYGDALVKQRAVGSFLSYYYNERGEFISGNNDFCLHISLAALRRSKKLIGIGLNVGRATLSGALATGLFTHLIVDEQQARSLL